MYDFAEKLWLEHAGDKARWIDRDWPTYILRIIEIVGFVILWLKLDALIAAFL